MAILSIPRPRQRPTRIAFAIATLALAVTASAQEAALGTVVVRERAAPPPVDVAGFGDVPLTELPLSGTVVDRRRLEASGARRLADLTQFDSSVTDAYNAPGYWDFLSIRGFTLDNRFNYRREGLPISAETSIPLDNKDHIEILKGTSGIQAGTSAPGGLVNYLVKRPTDDDLREVRLEFTGRASVLASVDLGGRFGAGQAFGYRVNAAHETLRPLTHNLDGERNLLSLAGDWRVTRDSVLSAEGEWSHKSQPSQVGFSLLGNTLPGPVDPRLNLNNQPWSTPSVFDAATGTLRFDQAINTDWRWSAQAGTQQLKTDDHTAFPYGCTAANGDYYPDRYCPDGTFDIYDFRSDNENRRQDAAALNLKGRFATGALAHDLSLGLMSSRVRNRFQMSAFNFAGTGNVQGTAVVPPAPDLVVPNTNRDERSTEVSAQDAIHYERFTLWLGLRHTNLNRESVGTDGSSPTSYGQGLTTPWLAGSYKLAPTTMLYASWGQGMESEVAPALPRYTNAGQALPALKSKQTEIGIKGDDKGWRWSAALFDITKPLFADAGSCDVDNSCTRQIDGQQRHRGVELAASTQAGPWGLEGGYTWLDAKRENAVIDPSLNGKRPINVPSQVVRAAAVYRLAAVPGLSIAGQASYEGDRSVVPDGSITLPGWTRLDAALRYESRWGRAATTWTLGVENLADKRYWKESPYQFSHVYLYPGAARTFRLAFTAAL